MVTASGRRRSDGDGRGGRGGRRAENPSPRTHLFAHRTLPARGRRSFLSTRTTCVCVCVRAGLSISNEARRDGQGTAGTTSKAVAQRKSRRARGRTDGRSGIAGRCVRGRRRRRGGGGGGGGSDGGGAYGLDAAADGAQCTHPPCAGESVLAVLRRRTDGLSSSVAPRNTDCCRCEKRNLPCRSERVFCVCCACEIFFSAVVVTMLPPTAVVPYSAACFRGRHLLSSSSSSAATPPDSAPTDGPANA